MGNLLDKDNIKAIFKAVKPVFKKHLGKYTHQRISGDWHFRGLGFVRDEMTYVFGFNVGFYKKDSKEDYDSVGMNVLIRTNGLDPKLREKYSSFFKEHLKDWYTAIDEYSSFRGGEGYELSRYFPAEQFNNIDEIIEFLKDSIIKLSEIYKEIIKNPDNIFDDVVKAAFPWLDSIIDVCEESIAE